jgi:hypothetical protein
VDDVTDLFVGRDPLRDLRQYEEGIFADHSKSWNRTIDDTHLPKVRDLSHSFVRDRDGICVVLSDYDLTVGTEHEVLDEHRRDEHLIGGCGCRGAAAGRSIDGGEGVNAPLPRTFMKFVKQGMNLEAMSVNKSVIDT